MAGFFGFFDYTKPGPGIPKDAPPKPRIIVFFEILSRKFWNLIKVNLMFLIFNIPAIFAMLFATMFYLTDIIIDAQTDLILRFTFGAFFICVPLITVGPAQAGLTYIMRNYAREEHAFIWGDFKEHALKNFKQSLIVSVIDFIVVIIAGFTIRFYLSFNNNLFMQVISGFVILAFVIFLMMHMYIYPMMVTFKLSIKQLYKNALLFAMFKFFPNLLMLILCFALVLASFINYFIGFVLMIFITFSLISLITNYFVYPKIKKYMMDKIEDGFRIAEFSYYLKYYDNSAVYSIVYGFERYKAEYTRYYPDLAHRVRKLAPENDFSYTLAYMVFLCNAYNFLPMLEYLRMPFVFTLCDGGYFHMNDCASDSCLRRVCNSPYLQKVIAPIDIVYRYLTDNRFIPEDKAEYVKGGIVTQVEFWEKNLRPKKQYRKDKDTFDICFAAYKYMAKGTDKGYDTFIEVAHKLAGLSEDIRFHVVGDFNENEIDVSRIRDRITFYGPKYQDFFPEFYSGMDVFLSLMSMKKEKMLHPGRISGVCNTTAVQTGMNGVAVFGIYKPEEMEDFTDKEDIVFIPEDVNEIVAAVMEYYNNPDALYRLSEKGRQKFFQVYSVEKQMGRRIEILNQLLGGN